MAKRFTDTEKWKKQWFRSLTPEYKCFWIYILDNCNHAGIWDVDIELASFCIGAKLEPDKIKVLFQEQYQEIDTGRKWFIRDFLLFQYVRLSKSVMNSNIVEVLERYGLTLPVPYAKGKGRDKETETETEKVTDKVKVTDNKLKHLDYVFLTAEELKKLQDKFGDAGTQTRIEALNNYIGSHGKRYKSHYHTILTWDNYDKKKGVGNGTDKSNGLQADTSKYDGLENR
jgi:hypothetical protein